MTGEGLILARGDRRDFVAIDRAGGMHALGKRILGASAAEIRARLSDLTRDQLPTVEEARQSLRSAVAPQLPVSMHIPKPVTKQPEEEPVQFTVIGTEAQVASSEEDVASLVPPAEPDVQPPTPLPAPVEELMKARDPTRNKEQASGCAAHLKGQFLASAKALFKRTPLPQSQARRRRTGETVGTFRLVARNLLRPIIRLPLMSRAVGFLNEALPWLHLWEWNEIGDHDFAGGTTTRDDNNHSPHP